MWFRSIDARAFGPLVGKNLPFETGLNVVHGPNESGKSSWHAAITAALCGLRRGAGRNAAAERLQESHRPWDAAEDDPWFVRLDVVLDDGSHIQIDRDLGNRRTDVRRADLGGRECTLPINEGSPDGSVLLGLDRKTFPMTASVRQAGIVSDLGEPDALQQHLARAAAGSTGGTAAGAIERIGEYKKEYVGRNDARSRRPLRMATVEVEKAEDDLARAQEAHREYLALVSEMQQHRAEGQRLTSQKARVEAQRRFLAAKQERERLEAAISEIDAWEERFSAGDPTRSELPELTELAGALGSVESLPELETTHLPRADELKTQLGELRSLNSLPCPELDEVERCVVPLRGAGSPEAARLAVPAVPVVVGVAGLVAAILLGTAFSVSYGIAMAVLALAVSWALLRRVRSATSSEARMPDEAKDAALRQLDEWQFPQDPVAAVAEASRRRQALVDQRRLGDKLRLREEFDAREVRWRRSHQESWARLRKAASAFGVSGSDDDVLARAQRVVDDNAAARRQRDEDVKEWGRFQRALKGRTPEQWRAEAATAREASVDVRQRLADDGVEFPEDGVRRDQLDAEVDHIDERIQDARDDAKEAAGSLKQVDQDKVDVAAAEARLSEAVAELERVERLAATLDTTLAFLEKAAENAHQLVAPRLGREMTRWIPRVTNGRYKEVQVDPGDLSVTLVTAAGDRRNARLVSRGTTEQAYLVLRLVLAQVLSADHETCPVLLDDPTVHADADRKQEILGYLLAASEEHQIILFSQEQEVFEWAKNQPDGAVHLIELAEPQPA